jgi:hypothetical protein
VNGKYTRDTKDFFNDHLKIIALFDYIVLCFPSHLILHQILSTTTTTTNRRNFNESYF